MENASEKTGTVCLSSPSIHEKEQNVIFGDNDSCKSKREVEYASEETESAYSVSPELFEKEQLLSFSSGNNSGSEDAESFCGEDSYVKDSTNECTSTVKVIRVETSKRKTWEIEDSDQVDPLKEKRGVLDSLTDQGGVDPLMDEQEVMEPPKDSSEKLDSFKEKSEEVDPLTDKGEVVDSLEDKGGVSSLEHKTQGAIPSCHRKTTDVTYKGEGKDASPSSSSREVGEPFSKSRCVNQEASKDDSVLHRLHGREGEVNLMMNTNDQTEESTNKAQKSWINFVRTMKGLTEEHNDEEEGKCMDVDKADRGCELLWDSKEGKQHQEFIEELHGDNKGEAHQENMQELHQDSKEDEQPQENAGELHQDTKNYPHQGNTGVVPLQDDKAHVLYEDNKADEKVIVVEPVASDHELRRTMQNKIIIENTNIKCKIVVGNMDSKEGGESNKMHVKGGSCIDSNSTVMKNSREKALTGREAETCSKGKKFYLTAGNGANTEEYEVIEVLGVKYHVIRGSQKVKRKPTAGGQHVSSLKGKQSQEKEFIAKKSQENNQPSRSNGDPVITQVVVNEKTAKPKSGTTKNRERTYDLNEEDEEEINEEIARAEPRTKKCREGATDLQEAEEINEKIVRAKSGSKKFREKMLDFKKGVGEIIRQQKDQQVNIKNTGIESRQEKVEEQLRGDEYKDERKESVMHGCVQRKAKRSSHKHEPYTKSREKRGKSHATESAANSQDKTDDECQPESAIKMKGRTQRKPGSAKGINRSDKEEECSERFAHTQVQSVARTFMRVSKESRNTKKEGEIAGTPRKVTSQRKEDELGVKPIVVTSQLPGKVTKLMIEPLKKTETLRGKKRKNEDGDEIDLTRIMCPQTRKDIGQKFTNTVRHIKKPGIKEHVVKKPRKSAVIRQPFEPKKNVIGLWREEKAKAMKKKLHTDTILKKCFEAKSKTCESLDQNSHNIIQNTTQVGKRSCSKQVGSREVSTSLPYSDDEPEVNMYPEGSDQASLVLVSQRKHLKESEEASPVLLYREKHPEESNQAFPVLLSRRKQLQRSDRTSPILVSRGKPLISISSSPGLENRVQEVELVSEKEKVSMASKNVSVTSSELGPSPSTASQNILNTLSNTASQNMPNAFTDSHSIADSVAVVSPPPTVLQSTEVPVDSDEIVVVTENKCDTTNEADEIVVIREPRNVVVQPKIYVLSEKGKNSSMVCQRCKTIWNFEVLRAIFTGSDAVTVNSRVTYGAIICINDYAEFHVKSDKEAAVRGVLERAELGRNIGMLKISEVNKWISCLIKDGKVKCCDVFDAVYKDGFATSSLLTLVDKDGQHTTSPPDVGNLSIQIVSTTSLREENISEEDYHHPSKNTSGGIPVLGERSKVKVMLPSGSKSFGNTVKVPLPSESKPSGSAVTVLPLSHSAPVPSKTPVVQHSIMTPLRTPVVQHSIMTPLRTPVVQHSIMTPLRTPVVHVRASSPALTLIPGSPVATPKSQAIASAHKHQTKPPSYTVTKQPSLILSEHPASDTSAQPILRKALSQSPGVIKVTLDKTQSKSQFQTTDLSKSVLGSYHSMKKGCRKTVVGSPCTGNISGSPVQKMDHSKTVSGSPVQRMDHSKTVSGSPVQKMDHSKTVSVSPFQKTDHSKTVLVSPVQKLDHCKTMSGSPVQKLDHCKTVSESPVQKMDHSKTVSVSPVQKLEHCKTLSGSPVQKLDHSKAVSGFQKFDHGKTVSGSPVQKLDHSKTVLVSPVQKMDHSKTVSGSPVHKFDHGKTVSRSPVQKMDLNKIFSVSSAQKVGCSKSISKSPVQNKNQSRTVSGSPVKKVDHSKIVTKSPVLIMGHSTSVSASAVKMVTQEKDVSKSVKVMFQESCHIRAVEKKALSPSVKKILASITKGNTLLPIVRVPKLTLPRDFQSALVKNIDLPTTEDSDFPDVKGYPSATLKAEKIIVPKLDKSPRQKTSKSTSSHDTQIISSFECSPASLEAEKTVSPKSGISPGPKTSRSVSLHDIHMASTFEPATVEGDVLVKEKESASTEATLKSHKAKTGPVMQVKSSDVEMPVHKVGTGLTGVKKSSPPEKSKVVNTCKVNVVSSDLPSPAKNVVDPPTLKPLASGPSASKPTISDVSESEQTISIPPMARPVVGAPLTPKATVDDLSTSGSAVSDLPTPESTVTDPPTGKPLPTTEPAVGDQSASELMDLSKIVPGPSVQKVSCSKTVLESPVQEMACSKTTTSRPVTSDLSTQGPMICDSSTPKPMVSDLSTPELLVNDPSAPRPVVNDPSTPEMTVIGASTPELTVSGASTPELTVSGASTPELTVSEPSTPKPAFNDLPTPKMLISDPSTPRPLVIDPPIPRLTASDQQSSEPTVSDPSAREPTLNDPSTSKLVISDPSSTEPTVSDPSAREPTLNDPSTSKPVISDPSSTEPTVSDPSAREPTLNDPSTSKPVISDPSSTEPTVSDQSTPEPSISSSSTPEPAVSNPLTPEPTVSDLPTPESTVSDLSTPNPTVSDPSAPELTVCDMSAFKSRVTDPSALKSKVTDPLASKSRVTDLSPSNYKVTTDPPVFKFKVTDSQASTKTKVISESVAKSANVTVMHKANEVELTEMDNPAPAKPKVSESQISKMTPKATDLSGVNSKASTSVIGVSENSDLPSSSSVTLDSVSDASDEHDLPTDSASDFEEPTFVPALKTTSLTEKTSKTPSPAFKASDLFSGKPKGIRSSSLFKDSAVPSASWTSDHSSLSDDAASKPQSMKKTSVSLPKYKKSKHSSLKPSKMSGTCSAGKVQFDRRPASVKPSSTEPKKMKSKLVMKKRENSGISLCKALGLNTSTLDSYLSSKDSKVVNNEAMARNPSEKLRFSSAFISMLNEQSALIGFAREAFNLLPFESDNCRPFSKSRSFQERYLTNRELLALQGICIHHPESPDVDLFYQILVQILIARNRVLLVPNSLTLLLVAEKLRRDYNRAKRKGSPEEFLIQEWDMNNLYTTEDLQLTIMKPPNVLTIRHVLSVFCQWKTLEKQSPNLTPNLSLTEALEKLCVNFDLKHVDKTGMCVRLYAKFCHYLYEEKNHSKATVFLNQRFSGPDTPSAKKALIMAMELGSAPKAVDEMSLSEIEMEVERAILHCNATEEAAVLHPDARTKMELQHCFASLGEIFCRYKENYELILGKAQAAERKKEEILSKFTDPEFRAVAKELHETLNSIYQNLNKQSVTGTHNSETINILEKESEQNAAGNKECVTGGQISETINMMEEERERKENPTGNSFEEVDENMRELIRELLEHDVEVHQVRPVILTIATSSQTSLPPLPSDSWIRNYARFIKVKSL